MENKMINGKEKLKELHKNYTEFIDVQERMIKSFGVFYCPECEEVHKVEERHKTYFICKEQWKAKERQRVKEYREKKKLEALAK